MTGIELIVQEREKQLEKYTVEHDMVMNNENQLIKAAFRLMFSSASGENVEYKSIIKDNPPQGWNKHAWNSFVDKPLKDRLVICGGLIAAELDRLQFLEKANERNLPKGVYVRKYKDTTYYVSQLRWQGSRIYVGCFRDISEAKKAYERKVKELTLFGGIV